jgi:hypothetical protein
MKDTEECTIMFWIISLTFRFSFLSSFMFAYIRTIFWNISIL